MFLDREGRAPSVGLNESILVRGKILRQEVEKSGYRGTQSFIGGVGGGTFEKRIANPRSGAVRQGESTGKGTGAARTSRTQRKNHERGGGGEITSQGGRKYPRGPPGKGGIRKGSGAKL